MRTPNPAEERVCRAFRQANIITADQYRTAMDLLTATEPCDKCDGTGNSMPENMAAWCDKCDSTGEMRTIR